MRETFTRVFDFNETRPEIRDLLMMGCVFRSIIVDDEHTLIKLVKSSINVLCYVNYNGIYGYVPLDYAAENMDRHFMASEFTILTPPELDQVLNSNLVPLQGCFVQCSGR